MFIKITCSNGFCGCDEEYYEVCATPEQANEICEDILQAYSFSEPDERFCDMDDEDEVENYYQNLECWWDEVSEEEYNEYKRD